MGRYDFLDEELKNKLEEKQKKLISNRKKEEVKKGKKEQKKKEGPSVYTKEDGSIGGVIYPENKDKPRMKTKSAADEILGTEEEDDEDDELPVKLHHTKNTKVGCKNRPKPKKKENPTGNPKTKNKEKVDEARDSIWQ